MNRERGGNRWFFVNHEDNGTWFIVMVAHTDRCPPESETAEALDWARMPNEVEIQDWIRVRSHGTPKLVFPEAN